MDRLDQIEQHRHLLPGATTIMALDLLQGLNALHLTFTKA